MALLVLTAPKIQIGTAWTGTAPGGATVPSGTISAPVDMSAMVKAVHLPWEVDEVESTNFGSAGFKTFVAGLKSAKLGLEFNQDFAGSQVNATIMGWGLGTTVYADVMPTTAGRGATNPSFVMAALITRYAPIDAAVGSLLGVTLEWPVTGYFAQLTA